MSGDMESSPVFHNKAAEKIGTAALLNHTQNQQFWQLDFEYRANQEFHKRIYSTMENFLAEQTKGRFRCL